MKRAEAEYRKFQAKSLSPVEEVYLKFIKAIAAKTGKQKGEKGG